MKNEEHRGLWSSIQQFPLDDPNAAITFSRKLAAQQNWSPFFTERVIEEYRKFLFAAVAVAADAVVVVEDAVVSQLSSKFSVMPAQLLGRVCCL